MSADSRRGCRPEGRRSSTALPQRGPAPLFSVALIASLLCGCLSPAPDVAAARASIVGGVPAPLDHAVFLLDIRGDTGNTSTCSATLIAPRTLLTAAHCVDPAVLMASSVTVVATNAARPADVQPGVNTVSISETRLHPEWRPQFGLAHDVALARLESALPTVRPLPWNQEPLEGLTGERLRVLGYGSNDTTDAGMGVRREADLVIRQLSPTLITLGNELDTGICHGDSGGPSLHTFGDSTERLVGVHSFTRTADCLDGADTRVDAYAAFIGQWLDEKEDVCGLDQVCATKSCTNADPDCLATGAACRFPLQCPGRACVADPQHPDTYCSRACATDAECPAPLGSCDPRRGVCQFPQEPELPMGHACDPATSRCTRNSTCDGPTRALALCSKACTTSADCGLDQQCAPGFTGQRICVARPIELPAGHWQGKRAPGCSTGGTGGGNTIVLLAYACVLIHARRRRSC